MEWQQLHQLETNLDDLSPQVHRSKTTTTPTTPLLPQVLAYACEQLLRAGALDAWTTPCTMKKGRMGAVLHVLCQDATRDTCIAVMLQQTSSLGVRVATVQRAALPRRTETVVLDSGDSVRVKVGFVGGHVVNAHPEYDDCVEVAARNNLPLKHVQQAALQEMGRRNTS